MPTKSADFVYSVRPPARELIKVCDAITAVLGLADLQVLKSELTFTHPRAANFLLILGNNQCQIKVLLSQDWLQTQKLDLEQLYK